MTAELALEDGEWRVINGVRRWFEGVPGPTLAEVRKLRTVKPVREFDPTLIACPTCHATVTQACKSAGGNSTTHLARLVSRRCPCGDVLEPHKQYCDRCRKRARKDTYRRREIRKATALRRRESLSTKGETVLGMGGRVCENGDGPNREVRATQPGPDHLIDLGERG